MTTPKGKQKGGAGPDKGADTNPDTKGASAEQGAGSDPKDGQEPPEGGAGPDKGADTNPDKRADERPPAVGDEVGVRLFMSGGAYRNLRGKVVAISDGIIDAQVEIPRIGTTTQRLERTKPDGPDAGWFPIGS